MSDASCARAWSIGLVSALALAVLAGCGSTPRSTAGAGARSGPAPSWERDGPEARPPSGLAGVPDAQPRLESIRRGGPNKPYVVLGRRYVPITDDRPFRERGLASWYGKKFHGRRTANGEVYDMYAMTAAHPTLPLPSYVRVRNPANDREIIVRVNDRGPFHPGRIIDLSYTAALKLGLLRGVAPVEIERITYDEIRAGTWERGSAVADARPEDRDTTGIAMSPQVPASTSPSPSTSPLPAPSTSAPPAPATLTAAPMPADAPAAVATAAQASAPTDTPVAPTGTTGRAGPGFWVQLAAFRQREGADGFHRSVAADLGWLAPLLAVFAEPSAFRLQAGPYASRDEAQGVAQRVREALNLVPVIIERR